MTILLKPTPSICHSSWAGSGFSRRWCVISLTSADESNFQFLIDGWILECDAPVDPKVLVWSSFSIINNRWFGAERHSDESPARYRIFVGSSISTVGFDEDQTVGLPVETDMAKGEPYEPFGPLPGFPVDSVDGLRAQWFTRLADAQAANPDAGGPGDPPFFP